jgi:hypothetical protein
MSTLKDVCPFFGLDDTHRIYGVFKDFQTLLAAVIALVAAAIAYLSAQRAARTQAKTAFAIQKQQFEETKATEDRARLQRECTMIIALQVKFELVERYINLRLRRISQIEENCKKAQLPAAGYLVDDDLPLWIFLRDLKPISSIVAAYDIDKEEISNLRPTGQAIYYSLHSLVSNYDARHEDVISLTKLISPKILYVEGLDRLKDAAMATMSFIEEQGPRLEEVRERLSKEFETDIR